MQFIYGVEKRNKIYYIRYWDADNNVGFTEDIDIVIEKFGYTKVFFELKDTYTDIKFFIGVSDDNKLSLKYIEEIFKKYPEYCI